jgi:hypothetical protein
MQDQRSNGTRHFLLVTAATVAAMLIVYAVVIPMLAGYHYGCDVWSGDTVKLVRLGLEWCK